MYSSRFQTRRAVDASRDQGVLASMDGQRGGDLGLLICIICMATEKRQQSADPTARAAIAARGDEAHHIPPAFTSCRTESAERKPSLIVLPRSNGSG